MVESVTMEDLINRWDEFTSPPCGEVGLAL
jgi:hypothetical protein